MKHFDNMLAADVRPDVVSCTALMTALGRVGQWERAERTIAWMHRTGVRPNVRTYTAYIAALGTAREWTRVANVLKSMRDGRSGVEPNAYTYAALLKVMGEQVTLQSASLMKHTSSAKCSCYWSSWGCGDVARPEYAVMPRCGLVLTSAPPCDQESLRGKIAVSSKGIHSLDDDCASWP